MLNLYAELSLAKQAAAFATKRSKHLSAVFFRPFLMRAIVGKLLNVFEWRASNNYHRDCTFSFIM